MKWRIRTLSIAGIWVFFYVYTVTFCYLYTENSKPEGVSCYTERLWCLYFCISYSVIPVFRSGKASFMSICKSFGAVVLLYIVLLGVQSPLYMIGSFFQPFYRNTIIHCSIFYFVFEWISLWLENKYATKNQSETDKIIINRIFVRGGTVVVTWILLVLYQKLMCKLAQQDTTYNIVCNMNSKDLLFLILYIFAIIFRWQMVGYASIIERFILIASFYLLYSIPLDFSSITASLMQEPTKNKFLHFLILYFIIENVSVWLENKYAPKITNTQL